MLVMGVSAQKLKTNLGIMINTISNRENMIDGSIQLIDDMNQKLDEQSMINANRAFNLGCVIGLLPAILAVIITFFVSGGAWIPVAMTGTLMMIAVLLLANYTAYTARNRTMDRVYNNEIQPQLGEFIKEQKISQADFNILAHESLPPGASLLKYLPVEEYLNATEEIFQAETGVEEQNR